MKSSNINRYINIGLNISYYRKKRNMTQLELAELVGVSRTHISNIEAPNMIKPLSLELVFNIADVLDVDVIDIIKIRKK